MYSPAFQALLIADRIEDVRRARGTSIQPDRSREAGDLRVTAPRGWISRVGIRRLVVADASSAPRGPRS
ncbi:MAG: hypothetical protein JOZ95_08825 [Solirubrobacterales bacterium]|nr:hypothetical protein [Solirubrobacterales bacterium]